MSLQVIEESIHLVKVRDELQNEFWTSRERLTQLQGAKTQILPHQNSKILSLGPKMESVLVLMRDHQFRTLSEISVLSGYESLTGLSAGIRSLRKFGHIVEKRKLIDQSEYEYRLV